MSDSTHNAGRPAPQPRRPAEVAEWHYVIGGKSYGPVTGTVLRQLAKSGKLTASDLVWREGMLDWLPAQSVGLVTAGVSPPAIPPPPPAQPASPRPRGTVARDDEPAGQTSPPRRRRNTRRVQQAVWFGIVASGILVGGFWLGFALRPDAGGQRASGDATASAARDSRDMSKSAANAESPPVERSLRPGSGDRTSDSRAKDSEPPKTSTSEPGTTRTHPEPGRRSDAAADVRVGNEPENGKPSNGSSLAQPLAAAVVYQEIDVQRRPTFVVQGMTMPQDIQYRVWSSCQIGPRLPDQTRKVVQDVLETRLDRADELSRAAFQQSLENLRGQQFTYRLSDRGDVMEFRGPKMNVSTPSLSPLMGSGFLMTSAIDEDGWKELAQLSFFQPDPRTPPGQPWTREMTHNWDPVGFWSGTTTFSPQGAGGGSERYEFAHAIVYQPPAGSAATLPFKISGAAFRPQQASGFILYDAELRRVTQAQEIFHVQGTANLELLGQAVPVQIEEHQTINIRLTDQDPRGR